MILRKRPPRERRTRAKVKRIKPAGTWPARVFRISPDPTTPYHVEVRVHRTPALAHAEMRRLEGDDGGANWQGLCRTWSAPRLKTAAHRPRFLVARIYLNVRDVQRKPGEMVSHECGHAAMGWARLRRANLRRMPGEEIMCYALGRMVAQVNYHLYALGVFP